MPVNQRSPSAEREGTAMYVLPASSASAHANLSAFGPFVAKSVISAVGTSAASPLSSSTRKNATLVAASPSIQRLTPLRMTFAPGTSSPRSAPSASLMRKSAPGMSPPLTLLNENMSIVSLKPAPLTNRTLTPFAAVRRPSLSLVPSR